MSLYEILCSNPALLADFKRAATPDVLSSDVLAWLRARPELEGFALPACIRNVRLKCGCPARRGGVRPQRGEIFYSVAGRGRVARGKECA